MAYTDVKNFKTLVMLVHTCTRGRVLLYSMLCAWSLLACITPAKANMSASQKTEQAVNFIEKHGTAMALIMGDNGMSKKEKRTRLKAILEKSLNLKIMTRAIVGQYWRKMSEQQRERYSSSSRQWIVLFSANLLSSMESASFEIISANLVGNDVKVETSIKKTLDEPPLPIGWRVRFNKKEQPLLIDMYIKGLSMISAQRSEATAVVTEKGIDSLLDIIEKRLIKIKKEFNKG